ncbi:VrrA/YqfQ family protein [Bacillus massiliglaciei]|uniref:VrrA/YqfQ family protein n=1 Tax=Bacillus massiliglaciei TaxID=1816693 RepID=UPI000DA636C7|nr:VrrA/YqfQ family protein [Bacillus massiliglaciei]
MFPNQFPSPYSSHFPRRGGPQTPPQMNQPGNMQPMPMYRNQLPPRPFPPQARPSQNQNPTGRGPQRQQPSAFKQIPGRQGPQTQQPKKEGLLSKFLGKNKEKAPVPPASRFSPPPSSQHAKKEERSSGGIMQTLTNPEALNGMLANTQKVLQAAEQVTPMVQQYGSAFKTLPNVWNFVKGFGSGSKETEPARAASNPEPAAVTNEEPIRPDISNQPKPKKRTVSASRKKEGGSSPKLFI